mgnify:CR=1 FL=1
MTPPWFRSQDLVNNKISVSELQYFFKLLLARKKERRYGNPEKQIEIEAIENEITAIIQSLLADIPAAESMAVTSGISVPGMIDTEGKTWLLGLQTGVVRIEPLGVALFSFDQYIKERISDK